jgi:hypothetical protein
MRLSGSAEGAVGECLTLGEAMDPVERFIIT